MAAAVHKAAENDSPGTEAVVNRDDDDKSSLSLKEFGAAKIPCTIDRVLRHSKYPEDDDSRNSILPIIIVRWAELMLDVATFLAPKLFALGQVGLAIWIVYSTNKRYNCTLETLKKNLE